MRFITGSQSEGRNPIAFYEYVIIRMTLNTYSSTTHRTRMLTTIVSLQVFQAELWGRRASLLSVSFLPAIGLAS